MMHGQIARALWGILALFFLASCTSIVVDGFHTKLPTPRTRVVVWGENPGAVTTATNWLQGRGLAIVERARLDQVLREQAISLTHTRDDQSKVLSVGKLLRADLIVFVEVSGSSAAKGDYIGLYGGIASVRQVYQLRTSVRAVDLETAEVVWTGSANYSRSIENLEQGITELTLVALDRAWCDNERWLWDGCQKS